MQYTDNHLSNHVSLIQVLAGAGSNLLECVTNYFNYMYVKLRKSTWVTSSDHWTSTTGSLAVAQKPRDDAYNFKMLRQKN